MSRLENKKKAGYFPTPPAVVQRIISHLQPPPDVGGNEGGGAFRWLDPCAGEGFALATLARYLGGTTYGIELDAQRAVEAERRLDRVLQGSYEAMRLPRTDAGISVLFENPPYDHDDGVGNRLELTFLRDTQSWLMPKGVLVYIIPQYRISGYVANRLATHFRDIRIYRFPDPEFEAFRQVVIFAVKRERPIKDDQAALRIAQAKTGQLPILPDTTDEPYPIPERPDTPFYFRTSEASPEDVLQEALEHGVWSTSTWSDHFRPRNGSQIQPLMPLRRGHIAMVLAAGLLDNLVLSKAEGMVIEQPTIHPSNQQAIQPSNHRAEGPLLVKGRLRKVEEDVSTDADREAGVQRTRERFQASITTLDLDTGDFNRIAGDAPLRSWMLEWQEVLAQKIVDTFEPLHRMSYDGLQDLVAITNSHSKHRRLPGRTHTGLFEAQRQVVAALTRRFLPACAGHADRAGHTYALLQATMGTGKTTISVSLADVLKKKLSPDKPFPVVVVCPPHLTEKWPREISQIVPLARGHVIRRVSDFEKYVRKVRSMGAHSLQIAVIPTTMLKLGSGWTPAVVERNGPGYWHTKKYQIGEREWTISGWAATFQCPRCGHTVHETDAGGETYPVTDRSFFENRRLKCARCEEPLYQDWRGEWPEPERDGFGNLLPLPEPRYPIARYIKKKHRHLVDLAIVDEVHQMKAQSSDRGHAFGVLAGTARRTLGMTGTLFGGMATSLFYLLHRLDHRVRDEFAWSDGQRFAALYGVLERVRDTSQDNQPSRNDEHGHYTGLRRTYTRTVEKPGISPALVTRLLDTTVFLGLEDLGFDLPEYTEKPVTITMPNGRESGPNMQGYYDRLESSLRAAAMEDWSRMGEYLQTTLCWPNAPWRDEHTVVGTFHGLPYDHIYPKERWLIDECQRQRDRGRRVLLYLRQTGTRDIQPRLETILTEAGLHVAVLTSAVGTSRRERWVQQRVRKGLDVLITNPRLVETGLDLTQFASLIFLEPEYSVYLIQQASRRSWRLGQTQPVEVYYAVYEGTTEYRALAHTGKKLTAALLLYGDDVAGALVDQAGAGGNLLEELARQVANNAAVPDLGEMFVSEHRKACPEPSRRVEGGGWLLGNGTVDLADEPTATPTNGHQPAAIDPTQASQLRMF